MTIPIFRIGSLYSSGEIQVALNVGNAGGVRVALNEDKTVRRLVVLTSLPSLRQAVENPYHDRIEGNVLIYTGAGKEGDQALSGANLRIPQQAANCFPVYGFQLIASRRDATVGPKRWKFLGLLQFIRHYPDTQLDSRGQSRSVWLFEFYIHTSLDNVVVEYELRLSKEAFANGRVISQMTNDDREVAVMRDEPDDLDSRFNAVEIERERTRLLAMLPEQFEHTVRDALVASGFERVQVTRYSQDGGIDVNAYAGEGMRPIRHLLLQVQAKRWLHTVGRKDVAELRGSLEPFARGAVVTTSHFSKAAISEAQADGKNPITLVDGCWFARTCLLATFAPEMRTT